MTTSSEKIARRKKSREADQRTPAAGEQRSYRRRRKQDRLAPPVGAVCVAFDPTNDNPIPCELVDINTRGCTVRMQTIFKIGQILRLELRLFNRTFSCSGTIASALLQSSIHRYGISFMDALSFDPTWSWDLSGDRRRQEDLYAPAIRLDSRLKTWKEKEFYHLFRQESEAKVAGVVDFTSNDYFGFSMNAQVLRAAKEGLFTCGLGTAGPAIFAGNRTYHEELMKEMSRIKGMEACLLCPSGFTANSGLFTGLLTGRPGIVFLDEKDHASIFHGAMSARARIKIFKHNDPVDLERKMSGYEKRMPKVICVEGVYSMDGDLAPLDRIYAVAQRYQAKLWVDDAHSFGVFGKMGSGIEDHFNLRGKIDIVTGSFSKAMAGFGGYICGRRDVIQYLEHTGREFVFTTTLPAVICAGVLEGLRILRNDKDHLRDTLWENTRRLMASLQKLELPVGPTASPIIPLILGHETTTQEFAKGLGSEGVLVNAVLRPAVRRTEARIRFTVRADHTPAQIDHAARAIEKTAKRMNLIH